MASGAPRAPRRDGALFLTVATYMEYKAVIQPSKGTAMLLPYSDPNRKNRAIFDAQSTLSQYEAREDDLTPVERELFARFLPPAGEILDLGVGTGRTTRFLFPMAKRYVGLDYSPGMVGRCKERFPEASLVLGDAEDLSSFSDESFDAAVFSYNGIDYLCPDAKRLACLVEIHRVLRPGGVFIFSTHNARLLLNVPDHQARLGWSPAKTCLVGAIGTGRLLRRRLFSWALWRGFGYVVDSAQGLVTHTASPQQVARELAVAGYAKIAHNASCFPRQGSWATVPWYYYVFRRLGGPN